MQTDVLAESHVQRATTRDTVAALAAQSAAADTVEAAAGCEAGTTSDGALSLGAKLGALTAAQHSDCECGAAHGGV